jgi:hypothetical protein
VAGFDIVLHFGTAQIEVAVLEADLFVLDGVFGGREGRNFGVVEDEELGGGDLDLAGFHLWVDDVGSAKADLTDGGDDVLGADVLGFGMALGRDFFVEDNLRDAVAVAQVEEDEVAVIAAAVDPAHEGDGFAGVGSAEFAAGMGALMRA